MYESFFGLNERPFQTTPQLQGYFAAEQIESALKTIISCVERGAGPAMVIASTGTGKTTLVLKLQEHFSATTPVAVLSGTNCRSPRSLLQNALFAVGLPYVDMDEGQMRLSLTEFFKTRAETGTGTLLLMDDADSLGTDLLEELLGFSSLTGQNGWCVPMVLIGSFRLEESLGSPRVASLNQRIAARCYIDSWSRSEVEEYITTRMEQSMAEPTEVFLPGAISKVCEITGGVPRVVNQLCDHALVMAVTKEQRQIDEFSIDEAWSDLQRLPLPANHVAPLASAETTESSPAGEQPEESIVEFGALDDDTDESSVSDSSQPEPPSYDVVGAQEPVGDSLSSELDEAPASQGSEPFQSEDEGYRLAPQPTDDSQAVAPIPPQASEPEDATPSDASPISTGLAALGGTAILGAAAGAFAGEPPSLLSSNTDQTSSAPGDVEASYPEQAEAMHLQRSPAEQLEQPTPQSLTSFAGEPGTADPGLSGNPAMTQDDSLTAGNTGETFAEETFAEETTVEETYAEMDQEPPIPLPPIPEAGAVQHPFVEEELETPVQQSPIGELPAIPPLGSVGNIPASVAHTPSEPSDDTNLNPFMEEFAEEEVVMERSVPMTGAANSITDTVETTEGQVLSSVMEMMEQQREAAQAEAAAFSETVETPDTGATGENDPIQDNVSDIDSPAQEPDSGLPPLPSASPLSSIASIASIAPETTSLPPVPDMPLGTPLGTVNDDQQTAEERFDQMLEDHSLLASELPTPSLHAPDQPDEIFQDLEDGFEDAAAGEHEGPPLGIPRGQTLPTDGAPQFDNLFTQLQKDQ